MGGRHAIHLTQAQFEELDQLHAFQHAFGLVGRQHAGLAQAPQVLGDFVVLRGHAGTGIDHENDNVGLGDGLARLFGHLVKDVAIGRVRLEASGVDDDEFAPADMAIAVVPVAGEAGKIRHDGIARLRHAIEQRGFADVGAPDERNDRFHEAAKRA